MVEAKIIPCFIGKSNICAGWNIIFTAWNNSDACWEIGWKIYNSANQGHEFTTDFHILLVQSTMQAAQTNQTHQNPNWSNPCFTANSHLNTAHSRKFLLDKWMFLCLLSAPSNHFCRRHEPENHKTVLYYTSIVHCGAEAALYNNNNEDFIWVS